MLFRSDAQGKPLISQGAVHIYKRVLGDNTVTVLGEVPASTVMQIGNAMEPKAVPVNQIAPNAQNLQNVPTQAVPK